MSKHPTFPTLEYKSLLEEVASNNALLLAIWNQLDKDVSLCGLQGFSSVRYSNFSEFFSDLKDYISELRKDKYGWLSLIYRIDLPKQLDVDAESDDNMAALFIMRTIHKIKLRKQFSGSTE